MREPKYDVQWDGDTLTLTVAGAQPPFVEAVVPMDGTIMLRDKTGSIVGKRVHNADSWDRRALGNTLAVAFGWGSAGPLHAIDLARESSR